MWTPSLALVNCDISKYLLVVALSANAESGQRLAQPVAAWCHVSVEGVPRGGQKSKLRTGRTPFANFVKNPNVWIFDPTAFASRGTPGKMGPRVAE
jgi:hypothetical protein